VDRATEKKEADGDAYSSSCPTKFFLFLVLVLDLVLV
jgi:hypothetical protein